MTAELHPEGFPKFRRKHSRLALGCGSWRVESAATDIGLREDERITGNRGSFVPHVIDG